MPLPATCSPGACAPAAARLLSLTLALRCGSSLQPPLSSLVQGAVQGPHSIAQFRKWLDSLARRPDLRE